MKKFTKKYQLWSYADNGYTFTEYDSLEEIVAAEKYSEWYITKKVNIKIIEDNK